MRIRQFGYRFAAGLLALLLMASASAIPAFADSESPQEAPPAEAVSSDKETASGGIPGYNEYYSAHAGEARPENSLALSVGDFADPTVREEDGRDGVLLGAEAKSVSLAFRVEQAGVYRLALDYYSLPGKSKEIVFGLMVDGAYPFTEAEKITLSRIYRDEGEIE